MFDIYVIERSEEILNFKFKIRTEDGQKETAKTGTEIQTRRKTEHWTTEEEMEGPTPL